MAPLDQTVGIRLAHLAGDEHFSLFGAEISSQAKLAAHYHQIGIETYLILEGIAVIYTGSVEKNDCVKWSEPYKLQKGDCFIIEAGRAHQLINKGENKLVVVFGCPQSHSSTDRILVQGIEEC